MLRRFHRSFMAILVFTICLIYIQYPVPEIARVDHLNFNRYFSLPNISMANYTHVPQSSYPNGIRNKYNCLLGPHTKLYCGMKRNRCEGYPQLFTMQDIIRNWHIESTSVPASYHNSLCRFNLSDPVRIYI